MVGFPVPMLRDVCLFIPHPCRRMDPPPAPAMPRPARGGGGSAPRTEPRAPQLMEGPGCVLTFGGDRGGGEGTTGVVDIVPSL